MMKSCFSRIEILCFSLYFLFQLPTVSGQSPYVRGSFPHDGARYIQCNTFLSLALEFPAEGLSAEVNTLVPSNFRLYPVEKPEAQVNLRIKYDREFQYLYLQPLDLLESSTNYVLEVSGRFTDERGNGFMPFNLNFTTRQCVSLQVKPDTLQEDSVLIDEPIKPFAYLANFQPSLETDTAFISWETTQEFMTAGFSLEHSLDGHRFDSLLYIASNGDSDTLQQYRGMDSDLALGQNFYRIKIHDIYGNHSYSDTVKVFKELVKYHQTRIKANGELPIEVVVPPRSSMVFVVKDEAGNIIHRMSDFVPEGRRYLKLSLFSLPPGRYQALFMTPRSVARSNITIY